MTLENKLGITSDRELAREEERLSKKRAMDGIRSTRWIWPALAGPYRHRRF